MIKLRDYQQQAIDKLSMDIEQSLRAPENEIILFQSPTGSGKTVMVSQFIKELVENREDDRKFSFIWISVRMLHEQSKEKLERYYEDDQLIKCSYFEDLEDRKIGENEILFFNWSSINKKNINIYVRDNEQDNNLNSIIQNTKAEGRTLVLIIDESHHSASSQKSKEIINVISPKITLEVSATPNLKDSAADIVKVRLSDVKAEGIIKSEVTINPEFLDVKVGSQSADELVISESLKKREGLAEMYKAEGSNVNPLLLIQLPDSKAGLADKTEEIVKILDKQGISVENGKLAIWLSENKSDTLPDIERNDNPVEVLVFKQAIALGWDCPRASILAIFRETKNFAFTIQTIGRIMRMPELRHYQNPELNKGYVFTNLADIKITEEYAKDYITVFESKRDDELYDNLGLYSIHLKRQRARTRLSGEFVKIFQEVAKKQGLNKKVNLKPSKLVSPIIADGKIVDIDRAGSIEFGGTLDVKLNKKELQDKFDKFIAQNCTPFAPADSSDRVKTALYQFFTKNLKFAKYDSAVQSVVLGQENIQLFVDAINLAKEGYKKEVVEAMDSKRELTEVPNWEVPMIISYNDKYERFDYPKSILKPFYAKLSAPEKGFIEFVNASQNVKWWFKNGESEIKYFAVLREDDKAFYPDFIVRFNDGRVGIFETKQGRTAEEAKERAESLRVYIKEQNKKGKNLWGGIVIPVNDTWRYNDLPIYEYDENDFSDWKVLSF